MRFPRLLSLAMLTFSAGAAERYALLLDEPPAAAVSTDRATLRARSQAIADRHEPVRVRVRAAGFRIAGETETLLNAIFVDAEPSDLNLLTRIEGVRYAAPLPRVYPVMDRAVQLINAPAAWSIFGGLTNAGAGVKVAVIDSGIEVTHPAFQDASLTAPAGFPRCGIYLQPLAPLDCTRFTNGKVIVARSYVPLLTAGTGQNPAANSRPDDLTPRDHSGHGTAVAMAAAGGAVIAPAGGFSGIAPKAFVGSYKVFGSPGVLDSTRSDAVIRALEDALQDGMDIAILSLGSTPLIGPAETCGPTPGTLCDVFVAAVENAVRAGLIVVAAAGNEGSQGTAAQPTLATMSSPGHAPSIITVGASTNTHAFSNLLTVAGLGVFQSQLGNGPAPAAGFSARLLDVSSVGDALACAAFPANSLAGVIAVISRGTCAFAVKIQNVEAAGGVGAVVVNNPGDNSLVSMGGLAGSSIVATSVGADDGQAIRTFLQDNAGATASVDPVQRAIDVPGNQVATFSSRGPVFGTGAIKPDVLAPGTSLYLAAQSFDPSGRLYSANGYTIAQGTSFSAPLVAGVAALVKQAQPGLTPAEVKSLVVNTATQDLTGSGLTAGAFAIGAGKADAAAAVRANVVASPSAVSFGVFRTSGPAQSSTVTLRNIGTAALNLTLRLTRRNADAGLTVSLDRGSLSLAAGQSGTFVLTLSGSLPAAGNYDGGVTVEGGASRLWIPFAYVVPSGVPFNIIPRVGDGDDGIAGNISGGGLMVVQIIDREGIPVPLVPVRFSVLSGGGRIGGADFFTDGNGLAGARPVLGPEPGPNLYSVTGGGLSTSFAMTGFGAPAIRSGGAVNAASFQAGVAPGSYLALFGSNFAAGIGTAKTATLHGSIAGISVSFDAPQVSVPGRLHFVTPDQINLQIPWELAGQPSAQIKVSINGNAGPPFTLPLTAYAPALFEYTAGGTQMAASLDESFRLIGPGNGARPGRVIQLYANGLGPVTNTPPSGEPTPLSPFSVTTTAPTVTIGGVNAPVQFSGLAPTLVGVYQLNVTVPTVAAGTRPLVVTIGGVTSKATNILIQ